VVIKKKVIVGHKLMKIVSAAVAFDQFFVFRSHDLFASKVKKKEKKQLI